MLLFPINMTQKNYNTTAESMQYKIYTTFFVLSVRTSGTIYCQHWRVTNSFNYLVVVGQIETFSTHRPITLGTAKEFNLEKQSTRSWIIAITIWTFFKVSTFVSLPSLIVNAASLKQFIQTALSLTTFSAIGIRDSTLPNACRESIEWKWIFHCKSTKVVPYHPFQFYLFLFSFNIFTFRWNVPSSAATIMVFPLFANSSQNSTISENWPETNSQIPN